MFDYRDQLLIEIENLIEQNSIDFDDIQNLVEYAFQKCQIIDQVIATILMKSIMILKRDRD